MFIISVISVIISAISVLVSAMSIISIIFAIPKISAIPALSTCWLSNQVPDIYPFFIPFYLLSLYNILTLLIIIYCLTSDMDPTRPTQTTPSQGGKLVYLQEENLCSLGEEKPYKLPLSDKKPQFAMSAWSSSPAGLRLRPVPPSLDVLNSLGTTASFSSLFKAGVHYVLARPCRLIAVYLLFLPYLNHPLCTISC